IGIMAASQVSRLLVRRHGPRAMLNAGVWVGAAGGLGVLVSVVADLGLAGLLPSLFVMVSSVGIVLPNAAALALADHPRTAGSASALLGVTQFATGAPGLPEAPGRPVGRAARAARGAGGRPGAGVIAAQAALSWPARPTASR